MPSENKKTEKNKIEARQIENNTNTANGEANEEKEIRHAYKETTKETEQDKTRVSIKSTTGLPIYYRKGLKFTSEFKEYEVSKEILDILKKDPHLTILTIESAKDTADKGD